MIKYGDNAADQEGNLKGTLSVYNRLLLFVLSATLEGMILCCFKYEFINTLSGDNVTYICLALSIKEEDCIEVCVSACRFLFKHSVIFQSILRSDLYQIIIEIFIIWLYYSGHTIGRDTNYRRLCRDLARSYNSTSTFSFLDNSADNS
jgi:hypothetical protein